MTKAPPIPPAHRPTDSSWIARIAGHEAFAGLLMMAAAAAALILANSGLSGMYHYLLDTPLSLRFGAYALEKPLVLWINDGLMALFFLLIGLELKFEMVEGRLNRPLEVALPGFAALGGMILPMAVFLLVTRNHPELQAGWAIPAATDIAFAVGVVALLGRRVPPALKIFLLTLAVLDDLGAILIIALFYGGGLQPAYLTAALVPLALMLWLNLRGTHRIAPILLLGAVLWFLVLKSGIHATVAGVVTAFFIPLRDRHGKSPLHALEHALKPYVHLFIAPVFALANAGVVLEGMALTDLFAPLPLAIALGLFLGKQLGVFAATRAAVALGIARLPAGVSWMQVYGIALLAGIGFTMSLFIGSLSFADQSQMNAVRLGVLAGSALAAIAGYLVLRLAKAGPETA